MRGLISLCVFGLFFLLYKQGGVMFLYAAEYSSASFKVLDPVLFPSGYSTSPGFSLTSTISQIAIGTSTAGSGLAREDRSGFLYFPFANSPVLSGTPGNGQVSLSWTASVGVLGWSVSGYEIASSTVSGGPYTYTPVGISFSSVTESLSNGTTYYFLVRALDAFGNPIASSSQIALTPNVPGGGGGGGGGTNYSPAPETGVVAFSGLAFPGATIRLLRDGVVIKSVSGDSFGNFKGDVILTPAAYQLGFSATDELGRHTALLVKPAVISAGSTTTLSELLLSPTFEVDRASAMKGESIGVSGYAFPGSLVTLYVSKDPALLKDVYVNQLPAAESGFYSHRFFVDDYPRGVYVARTRSATGTLVSPLSEPDTFELTLMEDEKKPERLCRLGDLNDDGDVDLVDFSIATYWYKKTLRAPFLEKEAACLNNDRKIDIFDFSLMAYYWTGRK
jgi:hypothetical protein